MHIKKQLSGDSWSLEDFMQSTTHELPPPFPSTANNWSLKSIFSYVAEEQSGDFTFLKSGKWRENTSKKILQDMIEESLCALWNLNIKNQLNEKRISKEYASHINHQGGLLNSEYCYKQS